MIFLLLNYMPFKRLSQLKIIYFYNILCHLSSIVFSIIYYKKKCIILNMQIFQEVKVFNFKGKIYGTPLTQQCRFVLVKYMIQNFLELVIFFGISIE